MELSYEQKLVVESRESHIICVACAGSGKTEVLTQRVNWLLHHGYSPKDIYAITYTNNAAQEMQERIDDENVWIGTIHSLANRILLQNGIKTAEAISEANFDELFRMIKQRKVKCPIIPYLLVDEFQDVTNNEFSFIFDDLKPQEWFVVGDSRQNIFQFKGGNFHLLNKLIYTPGNTTYELTSNYRNPRNIIQFANKFVAGMQDVYFTAVEPESKVVGIIEKNCKQDFDFFDIINRFDEYKDWFILCRTNAQVEEICSILSWKKIPNETFKKSDKTFKELKSTMESNTVKVLTIHSAKGLEAENVVVIGARQFSAEEKRLCYVAATRSRHRLYWLSQNKPQKMTMIHF